MTDCPTCGMRQVVSRCRNCGWRPDEDARRRVLLSIDDPDDRAAVQAVFHELDARRRVLLSIDDPDDRAAVMAVFHRVDWRRHQSALHDVRAEDDAGQTHYYGDSCDPPHVEPADDEPLEVVSCPDCQTVMDRTALGWHCPECGQAELRH